MKSARPLHKTTDAYRNGGAGLTNLDGDQEVRGDKGSISRRSTHPLLGPHGPAPQFEMAGTSLIFYHHGQKWQGR